MACEAYLTPSSYIVYKMAEGLTARLLNLDRFSPIFQPLKPIFH